MSRSPWLSLHIPGSLPSILQLVYSLSKDTGQRLPHHPTLFFFLVLVFIAIGVFTSQYTQRWVGGASVFFKPASWFVLSCHLYCSWLELVENSSLFWILMLDERGRRGERLGCTCVREPSLSRYLRDGMKSRGERLVHQGHCSIVTPWPHQRVGEAASHLVLREGKGRSRVLWLCLA